MKPRIQLPRLLLAGFLSLLLQVTVVPWLRVFGTGPDLPLALVVYLGLFHGDRGLEVVAFSGLLLGLAMDALSLAPLGLNGCSKLTCGCLAGFLTLRIFPENRLLQALITALAAWVQELIFLLASRLYVSVGSPETGSLPGLLACAVWGAAAALLFFPLFHALVGRARVPEPHRRSESLEI